MSSDQHFILMWNTIISVSCVNKRCLIMILWDLPEGVNPPAPSDAYMRQLIESVSVQIMASRLFGAMPLSKPMLGYCQLDPYVQTSVKC